jgi:hypothetical protein
MLLVAELLCCGWRVRALCAGSLPLRVQKFGLRLCFVLCRYISRYFSSVEGFSIWQLLPSRRTLTGCVLAAGCAVASNAAFMTPQQLASSGFWHQAALHVGVGVVLLAALGACIVSGEKDTMKQLLQLRRQRDKKD